ncbi:response regulator [Acanthopleuribacter pedis]|uniref:Response regulator n=1 Tax=Acanthopleuribacter pedis TaxID=442870 RepID=A0A8J7QBE9_9BACT|nr:response regulator [Acanthopleuribacter pedis]MBO1321357.1 response regulator [Acanthopleuribacter pedis]
MNELMLRERIEDILKTGNNKLLRQFLERELSTNRRQILPLLSEVVVNLEGRERLTFLEALLIDSEPDIIPVFIAAILKEGNQLFAKSMLLIYRNLTHFEAIAALERVRSQLMPALLPVVEKVMLVLRGRHHHRFFMQAFTEARDGGEALDSVLEDMLKTPNPDYVPFFMEHLRQGSIPQKLAALQGLIRVGEADLIDDVLVFLADAAKRRDRLEKFRRFLLREQGYAERVPADYAALIGAIAAWDDNRQQAFKRLLGGEGFEQALAMVRESFGLQEPLWLEVRVFLGHVLEGELQLTGALYRLGRAFQSWADQQQDLLRSTCHLLGILRNRSGGEDLTQKIEDVIHENDPLRPVFMVAYLKGCQSKNALKLLQAYISFPPDDHVLSVSLEALGSYKLERLPPQVVNLLHEHDAPEIHRQAVGLMIDAGFAEVLFEELLIEYVPALVATAAPVIAERKVPEGELCLAKLLEQVVDDEQALILIKALAAFPAPETGEAVAPFFQPGNPVEIRDTALCTLLTAGGPRAFATILEVLELYPVQKKKQLSTVLIKMLAETEPARYPEDLVWSMAFWTAILMNELDPEIRDATLAVLRKVDWHGAHHPGVWVETLREIAENRDGLLSQQDCTQLRTLAYKVESTLGLRQGAGEDRKSLTYMLDKVDDPCHHGSAGAFRRLNLMFKPHMLEDYPYEYERLINMVLQFLDRNQGVPELVKVAIGLCVRVADPRLVERVDQFLADPNPELVQFADRAMSLLQQRKAPRPIRSIHVVDDTRLITRTLNAVLSKAGYEVDIDNCPQDAMARLTQRNYDLAIVDLIMPIMDGRVFIREMRERRLAPDRVIVITSSRDGSEHQRVKALGIDGFLLKPFPMGKLVEMIDNLSTGSS